MANVNDFEFTTPDGLVYQGNANITISIEWETDLDDLSITEWTVILKGDRPLMARPFDQQKPERS